VFDGVQTASGPEHARTYATRDKLCGSFNGTVIRNPGKLRRFRKSEWKIVVDEFQGQDCASFALFGPKLLDRK
jgi:hypothetical protein